MDPTEIIERLCRRYRVPRAFGERLRPLILRATTREPDVRQRIMDMIERSFVQESERERQRERLEAEQKGLRISRDQARAAAHAIEDRVLHTVAAILHGWEPPEWIERFGRGESDASG